MEYRQLGNSGLRVSAFALGTMGFGGVDWSSMVGELDVTEAKNQVSKAVEHGINLIDTADTYSFGVAEQIVGQTIQGMRDKLVIATKGGMAMGPGPNDAGSSRKHLTAACEASLSRLGTDYIDLYQIHNWDGQTRIEETLDTLDSLIHSGKVRYVGVSNYAAWQLMKTLGLADLNGLPRFVSQQICYSLQTRDAEYELIPAALSENLGTLVWSPLAGGLLTGKYKRGQDYPEGTRRFAGWDEPPVYDEDKLYDIVDCLVSIADSHGVQPAQVALAWIRDRPGVTSVIIGARNDAQLTSNLGTIDLTLSDAETTMLNEVSEIQLLYPHWLHAAEASDRLGYPEHTLLHRFIPWRTFPEE